MAATTRTNDELAEREGLAALRAVTARLIANGTIRPERIRAGRDGRAPMVPAPKLPPPGATWEVEA